MKKILTFSAAIIFSVNLFSQAPAIQWQKSLGGTVDDWGASVCQTTDGGYIAAGSSQSSDGDVTGHYGSSANFDYWIIKLNNNGIIQWQKSFGGTKDDYANCVKQTADGGFIIAGSSFSNDSNVTGHHGSIFTSDYWIVKLSTAGAIQWQQSLGGTDFDDAASIAQTTDGGYIVTGSSYSNDGDVTGNHGGVDYWIVKLNSGGTIQWQKSLGGTSNEGSTDIQQTLDGGYIISGASQSNDGDVIGHHGPTVIYDYWVVKLDASGNIQWQKSLGGTSSDNANSIKQTTDGGYIVTGSSYSNDGDVTGHHTGINPYPDFWIVKLSSSGAIQWQKSLGGTRDEISTSIWQTTDGGYVAVGVADSSSGDVTGSHGGGDYWVLKLNGSGILQWQKCLGGTLSEVAYSIQQTVDGGYIINGASDSNDDDASGNHGLSDYWIVKLAPEVGIEENHSFLSATLYPNPFHETATLTINAENFEEGTLEVKNVLGETVAQPRHFTGNQITIQRNNLSRGVYFYTVTTREKGILNGKFIVD